MYSMLNEMNLGEMIIIIIIKIWMISRTGMPIQFCVNDFVGSLYPCHYTLVYAKKRRIRPSLKDSLFKIELLRT